MAADKLCCIQAVNPHLGGASLKLPSTSAHGGLITPALDLGGIFKFPDRRVGSKLFELLLCYIPAARFAGNHTVFRTCLDIVRHRPQVPLVHTLEILEYCLLPRYSACCD